MAPAASPARDDATVDGMTLAYDARYQRQFLY